MSWPEECDFEKFLYAAGGNEELARSNFNKSKEFVSNREKKVTLPSGWFTFIEDEDELGIPIHVIKIGTVDVDEVLESCGGFDNFVGYFCDQIEKVIKKGKEKYPNKYPGAIEVWDLRGSENSSVINIAKAIYHFSPIKDILRDIYPERVRKVIIVSRHWILDYVWDFLPERTKRKFEFRNEWES